MDQRGGGDEAARLLGIAPLRAVVRLAAPTTLVMAIAAASNVAQTFFVSRLGTDAIAAVSLVFPISLLAISTMAGGIGAGAGSAVARALGGHRHGDAAALAAQALALAVAIGVAFALATFAGAPALFRVMGAEGRVLDLATAYAHVLFGGAAITFLGGMFDSVLRGEGNVRVPAIWSSASLLSQIAVTPLCIFGLGLGIVGAPVAMLSCQALATLPRAWWVFGGRAAVRPALRGGHGLAPTAEILRVGVPSALSASVNNVAIMTLTAVVAHLGAPDLAAYGLGTRFDFLVLSFAWGFGAAVLTLVGMATGARRPDKTRAFVWRAGAFTTAMLAVPGLVLCWKPSLWLGLFTQDPGILEVGARYFRIVGPSYPFLGVSMVVAFAFQGLGRATVPLVWSVARVVGVVAAAIVCTRVLGLAEGAVFATIAIANVVSALALVTLFVRVERGLATELGERAAA